MKGKKVVAVSSAMVIGLTGLASPVANTVFANETQDTTLQQKLNQETESTEDTATEKEVTQENSDIKTYEDNKEITNMDTLESITKTEENDGDNTKSENMMDAKITIDGKEVSQKTKDALLAVNYANDDTIADLLAPIRFSTTEKLNKKLEIFKRDGIPITQITEEQVEKELKNDNVQIVSYGPSFFNVQNDIENIIHKLVENSTIEQGYTGNSEDYFVDKITKNKEKLLLGLSYIDRLYNFNMGDKNIKDILTYNPSYYGKQVDPLDWLIRIGGSGGDNLKVSNNTTTFKKLFTNTITNADSLISFLEENRKTLIPDKTMNEWFKETSKAIIVEQSSQLNPNALIGLYSKLSSETNLHSHILPLLTVSENSVYVITNSTTITYGVVDSYVDRNLKVSNAPLYQEKLKGFKQQLDESAKAQRDFIEFWYRIGKPKVHSLLSTNRIVVDSLRLYNNGTTNAEKEWSPKFGDNAGTGVREFITPMDMYASYFMADGQADGNGVRFFLAKALDKRGLSTYTHELTHLLDKSVWLNNHGRRDGLGGEVYSRGLFETYELDEAILNLNLIYDNSGKERFQNESPERFQNEQDIQEYMSGLFDVLYTLDYAEANAVLSKDKADKQKWFHKLEQVNDSSRQGNKVDFKETHKIDSVRSLSMDEADSLKTIYDLVDSNIIASRYEVNGLITTGDVKSNGYYVIPLFSSNYSAVQNENGVSGDIMMRRQAYELLAEYGYYGGLVPYMSNQYKDDATKDGKILSDQYILGKIFNGQYNTMADFKKAMFKERVDKINELKPVSISWKNQTIVIDNFATIKKLMKEAVDSDLKNVVTLPSGWNNIRAKNTQVELLKEEIFKAYLNHTDDFRDSIYRDVTLSKTFTVKFDGNGAGVEGDMPNQVFKYDELQKLNKNKFKRPGYTFAGWEDDKGNKYIDEQDVKNLVEAANGSITLYAIWNPIQYQVEFNKNYPNATGIMEKQGMLYDQEYKLNKNKFELKGYTFKGWATTADGKVKYKDQEKVSKLTIDSSVTIELYAVWEKNQEILNEVPTINATDKVLTVGDKFNPLDGVTAHDAEDGEIKLTEGNILSNDVDMSKVGTYYITYKVTDSKGASAVKTITVTVKEKEENKPVIPEKPETPSKPNNGGITTSKPNNTGPSSSSPQTGDMTNIGLLGSLFAGSSGIIAVILGKKRKKK